jgi:uncharacterized protein
MRSLFDSVVFIGFGAVLIQCTAIFLISHKNLVVMDKKNIIRLAENHMLSVLGKDSSGHDPDHSYCVRDLCLRIAQIENADPFIVELSALLHDTCDWKLSAEGSIAVYAWLADNNVPDPYRSRIVRVVDEVSFKGASVDTRPSTIEGMVVQDADRLDAIGARGIARCFAYSGFKARPIYDQKIVPVAHASFEDYKAGRGTAINHFYEKLLLLKDLMNTNAAREIAVGRHEFILQYLDRFFKERKIEL